MRAIDTDPIAYSKTKLVCNRTILPKGVVVGRVELGKGSNNRVVEATWNDEGCVIRMPRRRSDTQQKGAATWEFLHTLKASQLGVAPEIYAGWYAKHATREFPSGLYLITECFSHDLEDMLVSRSNRERMIERSDDIAAEIARCLHVLAEADMFLYDLKPSNLVVNLDDDKIHIKIIDFGRDFCEWGGTGEKDASTPTLDMLDKLVEGDKARRTHLLFATMMIQLAATTTRRLYEDRRHHRMDADTRRMINGIARATRALLDTMQGRHIEILRQVLRTDEVRGVLSHYHGRRNSGTRRTLRFARGEEGREITA